MIDEAVILLGGMGTRMLPYTKGVPKEMLPIYNVPNIFKVVEEAYLSGIKKIIFVVTKHNHDIIKNFFTRDKILEEFLQNKPDKQKKLNRINELIDNLEFVFIYQEILGTFGALYSAKDEIKNNDFIVMYGDDLIKTSIPLTKQLITEFNKTGKQQIALYNEKENIPTSGLAVLDENNNLIALKSKEETNSTLIVHGRMLLNKKIFTLKDKLKPSDKGEYYLPHSLLHFNDVNGYIYKGKYFNIGEKTGYIKASIYYALDDKDERDNLLNFLNNIKEEHG